MLANTYVVGVPLIYLGDINFSGYKYSRNLSISGKLNAGKIFPKK